MSTVIEISLDKLPIPSQEGAKFVGGAIAAMMFYGSDIESDKLEFSDLKDIAYIRDFLEEVDGTDLISAAMDHLGDKKELFTAALASVSTIPQVDLHFVSGFVFHLIKSGVTSEEIKERLLDMAALFFSQGATSEEERSEDMLPDEEN